MRPRKILKQLVPPLVVDLVRNQSTDGVNYIWKGVYSDFQSVPVEGKGHASDAHIELTRGWTEYAQHSMVPGETPIVPSEYSQFPVLAAVQALKGKRVSILDVGGGLGKSYVFLKASLTGNNVIDYHVLEVDEVCRAGKELFAGDSQISFTNALPGDEWIGRFDLVQFCSSLQYVDDYESLLRRVCAYGAQFLYLLKIPVGTFPTFATAQYNLPGAVTPVWFFNYEELVGLAKELGYILIYSGTHDQEYDTSNFEPRYRMRRYSHLLFAAAKLAE
jgi:putative methyltransferase (TIGR04325 family)